MSQTGRKDYTHGDYAVGWVCALSKEQTAAIAMLDDEHDKLPKPSNDHNTYTLGSIGRHNIVIACLPMGKIGTNSAATAVANMVSTFPSIKFALMVGIGGGIPSNKVRLGDVVVSSPVATYPGVVQWDKGKATEGGSFERIGALNNPPSSLLTALTVMKSYHELHGHQIQHYLDEMTEKYPKLARRYLRSDSLKDVLFKAGYGHVSKPPSNDTDSDGVYDDDDDDEEDCQFCDKSQMVKRKPRDMQIHYGLIASGNQVIKDAEFRDRLNKELDGKVLCVEMEAAGLMDNFPCLVIRGICDYADSHKNMAWQEHAAAVAAAYAKELLQHVQPSDVDGEHSIKDLIQQVLNTTSTTAANVVQVKAKIDSGEDRKILEWLTPMDYGLQQSDYLKRRQKGTGQWLLDSNEFQDWLSTSGQTLFCPGIPGTGKTILTSMVIDHLFTRFYSNPDIGIAYIYCNYQRQNEQNIDNLLASILKQLAESQPSLQDPVRDLYDRHEKRKTRPSYDEISRVLQSVVDTYSRTFIIVDALDECQAADSCRTRFLSELFHLRGNGLVSILVTSRDLPEISSHFEEKCTRREIRATTDDITRYLEGSMESLPSVVQEDKGLQREIVIGIAESVDGMFLLAQIYIKLLEDRLTVNDVRSALTVFSKQQSSSGGYERTKILEFAYGQALERINKQMQGQKKLALKVLSWITCAKRRLTLSELQHALATKPGRDSLDEGDLPHIKDLVSFCAGLVTVDKESKIIRLVHYTTQEYLVRTQDQWFPDAGVEIGMACVTYLSFRVFETGACDTSQEFDQRLLSNPLYDYAARHWGLHIPYETGSDQVVINFLQNQKKIDASVQALMARMLHAPRIEVPKRMIGLHLVGYFGLSKAVDILVAAGQCVNAQDFNRSTPLIYAGRNGDKTTVKRLLAAGADINAPDEHGYTALCVAAVRGHLQGVERLLAAGADINAVYKDGRTVLHQVASFGRLDVIERLLAAGADINAVDKDGRTVLHEAASFGRLEVIEGLLAAGADINTVDKDGYTVLHKAALFGRLGAVEGLLAAGADINAPGSSQGGKTALQLAAERGHRKVVERLRAANPWTKA